MAEQATLLPNIIRAFDGLLRENADAVTALDQAIGDGDHVFNVQRGLEALLPEADELGTLDWSAALKRVGLNVMSTVGGASGSLYGTFFVSLSKALNGRDVTLPELAEAFAAAVDAVKARGRAGQGEKTMLDVLIPVSESLRSAAAAPMPLDEALGKVRAAAEAGVEATRDLLATKGRASFLGERARGHIDPGARTSQLMIEAVCSALEAR